MFDAPCGEQSSDVDGTWKQPIVRSQPKKGELQMTINDSTALITGGTSGIGRATANKLAQL
ncbi:MAG TPA: hypothetical protein VH114_03625, partial [Candidatus Acidoferrum sp.]|nr:hypothetical protein [Candidatus Acidoferrum sp.]